MPKILICVGDGIGNMIMATPMISALYQMECEIDIYGKPNYENTHHIFKNRPEVNEVLDELSDASAYDAVLATIGGFNLSKTLINVKRYALAPSNYYNKSEIENNIELARNLGWDLPTPDTFCGKENTSRPLPPNCIALHNGSHPNLVWKRKSYPSFSELVEKILEETDYQPVILGSSSEHENWMDNDQILNFTGKTDILYTAGLISECELYVGTDSGLSHIAAALNVPTYVLWGSTNMRKNLPPKAIAVQNTPICEPCQEFYPNWEKQGRWGKCVNWKCMQIPPDDIIKIIKGFNIEKFKSIVGVSNSR
jgi:ADP-heptose:LPS heptosyltransferase